MEGMPRAQLRTLLLALLATGVPGMAESQERMLRFERAASTNAQTREPASLRPLRIAKWSSLAAAAGFATLGFIRSGEADDAFRDLEAACHAVPVRCAPRNPDGSFMDAVFEARYQEVLDLDGQARTMLILSQVGVAASVVLFLLDLRNNRPPPDIPYAPTELRVGTACGGGGAAICVRWKLGPVAAAS